MVCASPLGRAENITSHSLILDLLILLIFGSLNLIDLSKSEIFLPTELFPHKYLIFIFFMIN